ncbi:MAG TPA: IS1634 family transposase [Pyrinomonadaceae bacterium]|nr:IS1634 family transposase [Pyrinomonadaceae bacterium]
MFLRYTQRLKDGKEHRYWSIVENRRGPNKRVIQRQVLYLGEINDSQKAAWCESIGVFDSGSKKLRQVALFPEDREAPELAHEVIHICLDQLQLRRPRQWGACWLSFELWEQLRLDEFWREKLRPSREGTDWLDILKTLVSYRLIDPGSEWRLHREWYQHSAIGDLLGRPGEAIELQSLYRCQDKLLAHKEGLFRFLTERWRDLFHAEYEVLLYDLTSTYFECDPPEQGKRRFGYSRDKRPDCVQVVIALVITTEGLPIAYEVMPGNTSDKTTLKGFLEKIERQYGKAKRTWVMDRGVPTEDVLREMRAASTPVSYLVGTPRGRLTRLEKDFLKLSWAKVKDSVEVKLLPQDGEVYILARSHGRMQKERAMRRRRLKRLWKRLHELQLQKLTRDDLLLKLGAAKSEAGNAYRLVDVHVPKARETVSAETFTFSLRKEKFRAVIRNEGHYLLRSNLSGEDPAILWQRYIQLTEIEAVFRNLKSDLAIRPIHHQKDSRIEAHIFVAFLAYCLYVTLQQRLRALAPGLTSRAVIEKMSAIQMVDVHLPTTDGRLLILPRYTIPEKDHQLLLQRLHLILPPQPPPRVSQEVEIPATGDTSLVVKTF